MTKLRPPSRKACRRMVRLWAERNSARSSNVSGLSDAARSKDQSHADHTGVPEHGLVWANKGAARIAVRSNTRIRSHYSRASSVAAGGDPAHDRKCAPHQEKAGGAEAGEQRLIGSDRRLRQHGWIENGESCGGVGYAILAQESYGQILRHFLRHAGIAVLKDNGKVGGTRSHGRDVDALFHLLDQFRQSHPGTFAHVQVIGGDQLRESGWAFHLCHHRIDGVQRIVRTPLPLYLQHSFGGVDLRVRYEEARDNRRSEQRGDGKNPPGFPVSNLHCDCSSKNIRGGPPIRTHIFEQRVELHAVAPPPRERIKTSDETDHPAHAWRSLFNPDLTTRSRFSNWSLRYSRPAEVSV